MVISKAAKEQVSISKLVEWYQKKLANTNTNTNTNANANANANANSNQRWRFTIYRGTGDTVGPARDY